MSTDVKDTGIAEALWREYEPKLRRICDFKLAGYASEIDDVIGDTYLALCNVVEKGVKIDNPKAWLYGTLNNIIKLKYAEMDKRKRTYIRLDSVEHELFYDIDFDEVELSDERIDAIKNELFDELSDSEKTLLTFIYEKRLKVKEIARILSISEAAVKQKHYRLKRKIKRLAKEKINKFE